MNRLSISAIHLLFTTLLLLPAAFELKGQSVQLSVDVDRSISGVESDDIRYFGQEDKWKPPETYVSVTGSGLAGCIAIRSEENVPVILSAELLYADPQPGEKSDTEFQIGVINDGNMCHAYTGMQKTVSTSTYDNRVSFRLNQSPRTIRNLHLQDGVVKGYVIVLTPPEVSGYSEDKKKRQPYGQKSGAVVKIDIEYL